MRSVSSDGLIWTIDGAAAHANELRVGKIMFATSFGAGRVLAIQQSGPNKIVAIGPVALTDIIRDGSFATTKPVGLAGFAAYSTPERPGLITDLPSDNGAASTTTASLRYPNKPTARPRAAASDSVIELPTQHFIAQPADVAVPSLPGVPNPDGTSKTDPLKLPPLPAPSVKIPDSELGGWSIHPTCCDYIGIHLGYAKNGAKVQGNATLRFERPSVTFSLSIAHGSVLNASAKLNGVAGFTFDLLAAVESSAADFKGGRVEVPVDIAFPVPIGNLPVVIGIQQIFSVSLGLGGEASFSTHGEYAVGGSLGFSIGPHGAHADIPTLQTTKSALDSMRTFAIAPSGLLFAYALKVSIGVGPPIASASIWYKIQTTLGLATSGTAGTTLVACKSITLAITGTYGVGYQVPEIVASAINFFLQKVFKRVEHFDATGGKSWGPDELFERHTPPCSK